MDGQPDRSRFLSSSAVMDTATPSPLFTDLARHTAGLVPSCTAADSSLHSRYIQASLPLGSASTCPFLGGMYAGSLPAPPNSPFRSPTGNIRQFWPPTPPPEGYNRYGVSPAIYPLFPSVASIAPTSENGTLLTPGLGSRLGNLPTHFPHLLDSYSDPTYYSSGYGLSSSLPPSSHITPNLSLSNLAPNLERHPSYVPLVGRVKGLNVTRQTTDDDDINRIKNNTNSFMKWDMPFASENSKSSVGKVESQLKSKDFISNKDETKSASCKGKGENRVNNKKSEMKHQVKQAVSSGGDNTKSTSVINNNLSTTLSDSIDLKSQSSRNGAECPKCVVNPSSIVRAVNTNDVSNNSDGAVLCLGHTPAVDTVTRTVAPSLPNCTVANNHHDSESVNGKVSHPSAATLSTQSPTAITYVSRQLCYQSIQESTVSKSATGSSSCVSVKISGHVTSVSSSQVVLDDKNGNKTSSEETKLNIEAPIWTEKKLEESEISKDLPKVEELQSETLEKPPVTYTSSSTVLSPLENNSSLQTISTLSTKDHSQHVVKVPSSVSTIIHAHPISNRLSTVCCKNIKNTKLSEIKKISNIKDITCLPISIQPKKEQSPSCKIEQVKPSLPNNWNESKSLQNVCDSDNEPQAINLSLPQKLPKSEPNELPNCKNVTVMKIPVPEKSYLPVKSVTYTELTSNSHVKTNVDTCIKTKKLTNTLWPQTQNLVTRFEGNSSCQSQVTAAHSLNSVSIWTVKNCMNQQSVIPSSTPVTNVSSLVKPTLSATNKSSLKSPAGIKLAGRAVSDSNCHRNSISIAPSLSSGIDNTRKSNSDEGQNGITTLPSSITLPFSGTVNSSIPVGIAIAQQRQETTISPKTDEKHEVTDQTNHLTSTSVSSAASLLDIVRDQKSTDRIPRHSTTADAGSVLVTLGPTTLNSNQWDSDNNSRTSMSQPWVTHTPVVGPTVWVGQSVPSTPSASTLPVMPVSTLDTTQVPVSTGGFQLARDPLTGHLYLIPSTSIELTDNSNMWPVFVPTAGSVPLQQVVPNSQNNQIQSIRLHTTAPTEKTFCDINTTSTQENHDNSQFIFQSVKQENKDDKSSDIPLLNGLPVATGQPFAYAAFSLHGGTISYFFEPSSVVHLAQTQVTASIQTESGKISQGTSPLHSFTPSPPPPNPAEQNNQTSGSDEPLEEEEESDDSSANQVSTQTKLSTQALAVATATQVDMNSDDDYEERNIETSDSACQTEAIIAGTGLREDDAEDDGSLQSQVGTENNTGREENSSPISIPPAVEEKTSKSSADVENNIQVNEIEKLPSDVCQSDVELSLDSTPVLTAESKPVMDFIDHHGLDLLVDSIEEFACREQEKKEEKSEKICLDSVCNDEDVNMEPVIDRAEKKTYPSVSTNNQSSYSNIDPLCVDGLGLLCALAEQRFLEETMNLAEDKESEKSDPSLSSKVVKTVNVSTPLEENKLNSEPVTMNAVHKKMLSDHKFGSSLNINSVETMEATELEMRIRMAELQHKYKQKQQELSRLRPKKQKELDNANVRKPIGKLKGQHIFTYSKDTVNKKPDVMPVSNINFTKQQNVVTEKVKSELEVTGKHTYNCTERSPKLEEQNQDINGNQKQTTVPSVKEDSNTVLSKVLCTEQGQKEQENLQPKTIVQFSVAAGASMQNSKDTIDTVKQEITVSCSTTSSEKEVINHIQTMANSTKETKTQYLNQSIKVEEKENTQVAKLHKTNTVNESTVLASEAPVTNMEESSFKPSSLEAETSNSEKQNKIKHEPEKKVPFFDEAVWSIRRSERIFLHEAGVVKPRYESSSSALNKNKRTLSSFPSKVTDKLSSSLTLSSFSKLDSTVKTKMSQKLSDSVLKVKKKVTTKRMSDLPLKKRSKLQNKQNHNMFLSALKKNCTDSSTSSDSDSNSEDSDSSSSSSSSDDSDDTPLSALIKRPLITVPDAIAKAKSCIMTKEKLLDKQRVLMMEDGLFYAGNVIAIHAPDVYGIHLDGDRGSRLRIYSMEEMLKETVLEVKPTSHLHLIEGARVCAFWSQQYRCLYPGTVTKSNSQPDDSLIYVEFDDGDSGRIPLDDIRLLPPNYPIVTVKPTPLLALKRRHCALNKQSTDDKKLSDSIKDFAQINKKTKISASNKKSKYNQSEKSCQSSFHVSKSMSSVVTSNDNNVNISTTTSQSVNLSLMNSKKILKTNSKLVYTKEMREKLHKSKTNSENRIAIMTKSKPKKHKKHHDESRHHRHHHHRHHHHKKRKLDKQKVLSSLEQSGLSSVYTSYENPCNGGNDNYSITSESSSASSLSTSSSLSVQNNRKKSELTVKIKTSTTEPMTHHRNELNSNSSKNSSDAGSDTSDSSDDESIDSIQQDKKSMMISSHSENCEKKKRDRRPSVEKSKIAAFLPARQLWRWSGTWFRRRGTKGRAKKEFYKAVTRGKETITVGDCAVFLSTGRPHLPYIGRIETMWQSWGGNMVVKVKWFYHPEETKGGKRLAGLKGALFQSSHLDENDVQTISHKCEVLSWEEYKKRRDQEVCQNPTFGSIFDNNDIYYLAGTYEPTTGIITMEPGIT